MTDLDAARERMHELDEQLLRIAAERVRLARKVAQEKERAHAATLDYAQERRVLERGRATARDAGLDEAVAEDLLERLIRASVHVQEAHRLEHAATGEGKTAVVVGGAGRMGQWMVGFLEAQGFDCHVLDPAAPDDQEEAAARVQTADLVLCATPPGRTADLYEQWVHHRPKGVVCDISSIKTPLLEPMAWLMDAGVSVASIHPMFGPDAVVLRDQDVVICDTGDQGACAFVEELWKATTARIHHVPLESHDEMMAHVLALAHATAIAFATALPEDAAPVASTTFNALEALALDVVQESPEVYFEVQADNSHAPEAVSRLRDAVGHLRSAVELHDKERFKALMEDGLKRLRRHRERREVEA